MQILPIYNASEGGFVFSDGDIVKADTLLIGEISQAWMHKIAMVSKGLCTADEAIREVIAYIYHNNLTPRSNNNLTPTMKIPPELFMEGLQPEKYPETSKMLTTMFRDYLNLTNNLQEKI